MPQIEMVEVAGIPDEKYGEIVGAFIKLKAVRHLPRKKFRNSAGVRSAGIRYPRHVIFVDDFPKTASGKIQKYKFREMGLEYVKSYFEISLNQKELLYR